VAKKAFKIRAFRYRLRAFADLQTLKHRLQKGARVENAIWHNAFHYDAAMHAHA
jgi:hypothetical protein